MSGEYGTIYFPLLMPDPNEKRRDSGARGLAFICCCCCITFAIIGAFIGTHSGDGHKDHPHHHHKHHHKHHPTPHPTRPPPSPTPFCCTQDSAFVFPGSPWASTAPTLCGDFDYNCDGKEDRVACCAIDVLDTGNRTMYTVSEDCEATDPISQLPNQICGACTDGTTVVPGWQCSPDAVKKRFVPVCPESCDDAIVVTPTTEPQVGQCAMYVTSCIPPNGGDGSVCCQVAIH